MSIPGFSTISNLITTIRQKARRFSNKRKDVEYGEMMELPEHTDRYINLVNNDQGECPYDLRGFY